MKPTIKVVLCLFIYLATITGVNGCMNNFQSDFQNKWEELSKDVNKLNEYTAKHPNVELDNFKVSDVDLEGAVFNGAVFKNVEWTSVSAQHSKYRKATFKNCKFVGCKYWYAKFVDVVFEDCEFISSSFLKSKIANVKIINCKATEAEFDGLEGTELLVKGSEFNTRSSFTDCKVPLVFQDSTLSGVNMMGLTGGKLTIEGGLLDEVDFYKSHFSDVTLRRVKQGEGPTRFNGAIAKSFRFEDVNMTRGVSLAHVRAHSVSIVGGTFRGATEDSTIAKIYAHDANLFMYDMSESKMPFVKIWNCKLKELAIWECFVDEFSIKNSTLYGVDATAFKADTVVWDDVTLDGKIDFTNAHIKDFRLTRLKRGPQLQLITTGSNVSF